MINDEWALFSGGKWAFLRMWMACQHWICQKWKLTIQDFIAQSDGAEVRAVIRDPLSACGRDNKACSTALVGKTSETVPSAVDQVNRHDHALARDDLQQQQRKPWLCSLAEIERIVGSSTLPQVVVVFELLGANFGRRPGVPSAWCLAATTTLTRTL